MYVSKVLRRKGLAVVFLGIALGVGVSIVVRGAGGGASGPLGMFLIGALVTGSAMLWLRSTDRDLALEDEKQKQLEEAKARGGSVGVDGSKTPVAVSLNDRDL